MRAIGLLLGGALSVGCFDPDAAGSNETDTAGTTGVGPSTTASGSSPTSNSGNPTSATNTETMGGTTDAPTSTTTPTDSDDPDPVCGDEILDDGEDCDDGNTNAGDGCSSACLDETVFCEPELLGAFDTTRVGRMVAEGGYVYSTPANVGGGRVRVFDVSDPALISEEGFYEWSTDDYPSNRMIGIAKDGNYIFVGGENPEFFSLDVSSPSTPMLGYQGGPNITNGHVQISGDHLYHPRSVSETVQIWNISDGADPMVVGQAGDPGNAYYNAGVNDTHAFISTFNDRIDVVDISVPAATSVVGQYTHATPWSGSTAVRKIVANDNVVAIATAAEGIILLDASLPTAPDYGSTLSETPEDIVLFENLLFVPYVDGLRVYDIGDPSDAELAASYVALEAYSFGVTYDDANVYVSTEDRILVLGGMPGLCASVCGNSTVEYPEDCDDGNREDGDGCPANCEDDDG